MEKGKISVCIPVYNGEMYLSETLESVLQQTFSNFEILIQDNNSSDKTSEIIETYIKKDSRIKLERNEKVTSMARNWNIVVNRASGEYVLLLSADDLLDPEFFNSCIDVFNSDAEIDFVSAEHRLLIDNITRNRRIMVKPGKQKLSMTNVLLKNPLSINFTIFRKKSLDGFQLSDKSVFREPYFTCDYDLWIRIAEDDGLFFYLEKPLATYRVHTGSLSNKKLKMLKHTVLVLSANTNSILSKANIAYKITYIRMLIRFMRLTVCEKNSSIRRIRRLILGRLFF